MGDFLNFFGEGRQNRACALKTSEIKHKRTINIILRSNLKAPSNTSTAILRLILVANDKCNPYLFISHSFISAVPSRTGTRAFIYPTAFLPDIYQSNHNNSKRWGTYFHFQTLSGFTAFFPDVLAFPNAASWGPVSPTWSPWKSRGSISWFKHVWDSCPGARHRWTGPGSSLGSSLVLKVHPIAFIFLFLGINLSTQTFLCCEPLELKYLG